MSPKQKIKEAERLYRKSLKYYRKNKKNKADLYYREAMHKLYSVNLNSDTGIQLENELNSLFSKLKEIFENLVSSAAVISGPFPKYTIDIDENNQLVQDYIKLYIEGKSRERIKQALSRSGAYRELILKILDEYDLPEELVYLPVVESLYKANAYSRTGAAGIWQLMPGTGRSLGLKINLFIDERWDPEKATVAACKHLNRLYQQFGDWHLALAAYNRGANGLKRDILFSKSADFNQLSDRDAIPRETDHFVPKFMASTIVGDNREIYFPDIELKKTLEYDAVEINNVIDLEIIAKCAGTDVKSIKKLNPALRVWCTPNNYPNFKLKLPPGTRDAFLENISRVKDLNPSRGFVRYRVKRGDNLGRIAARYYTTVKSIKKINRIKRANLIHPGQILVIKPGRKYYRK